MSKYDLTSDARIVCDSSKISDGGLLAEDLPEDIDEGLARSSSRPRRSALSIDMDYREKDGQTRSSARGKAKPPVPPVSSVEKQQMDRAKRSFASWMFVLYRIASICLLIVFAGGMFFGTRTLLSLGKVINRQVEVTETALSGEAEAGEETASAQTFITFDEGDAVQVDMTTADIKMGNVAIKLSANETIIVMALEYAVGFAAMLLFMNFHKIELKL